MAEWSGDTLETLCRCRQTMILHGNTLWIHQNINFLISLKLRWLNLVLQNQKNYATKFPRLEIEETKEVMVDEIEVEDPLDKKRNEELLLIQRQY